MKLDDLLSAVAGTCTTLAFLPQVLHTLRTRDVKSLSLGMYVVFTSGIALWIAFGIVIRSWPVIITNVVTFVLAALVLGMKLRYGREQA